jgi:hypothetical protein
MKMSRDVRISCVERSKFVGVLVLFAANMTMLRRAAALVGPRYMSRSAGTSLLQKSTRTALPWTNNAVAIQSPPRRFHSILMAAVDEDEAVDSLKTLDSTWNIPGLRKEVTRFILRSHKKIAKASTRLTNAQEFVEKLTSDDYAATMEELETCPDVDALEFELKELRTRLQKLNELEHLLNSETKKQAVLSKQAASLALELGVNDEPPKRPLRVPKKKKGPRQEAPRKPYKRYYTINKTEIRVGKRAEDNDELSLRPEHRDGSDWWMHASGCPGSHVVIRCSDQNLDEEVVKDAAALAARQSKCSGSVIKVSLTRCRDVKKPPGAKAGLVQLTGKIRTITVNMKEAESRLERLDKTVEVN